MKRKLIIDGNAVFELDEECMVKKQIPVSEQTQEEKREEKNLKEWKEFRYSQRR